MRSTNMRLFVLRALYYLAILVAMTALTSHQLGQHPSFVYQGF